MTLSPDQFQRLQYLLGKQQVHHWLSADETVELRTLLQQENPSMGEADWDALVKFGFLVLGAYLLFRALGTKS